MSGFKNLKMDLKAKHRNWLVEELKESFDHKNGFPITTRKPREHPKLKNTKLN